MEVQASRSQRKGRRCTRESMSFSADITIVVGPLECSPRVHQTSEDVEDEDGISQGDLSASSRVPHPSP
jgi:hypothetical protein